MAAVLPARPAAERCEGHGRIAGSCDISLDPARKPGRAGRGDVTQFLAVLLMAFVAAKP
jgi:hypothetical protein